MRCRVPMRYEVVGAVSMKFVNRDCGKPPSGFLRTTSRTFRSWRIVAVHVLYTMRPQICRSLYHSEPSPAYA
ncbi:hypothetical protein PM082_016705 [Marasmius tenuissimus]|nr:hypothetical protein PM082_016705 [Marasmius tenuissimus]